MENAPINPFPVTNAAGDVYGWKWYDETGGECERTYRSRHAAYKDLMRYCYWLEHGPTLWQRMWWPLRYKLWPLLVAFWNDQSSGARRSKVR